MRKLWTLSQYWVLVRCSFMCFCLVFFLLLFCTGFLPRWFSAGGDSSESGSEPVAVRRPSAQHLPYQTHQQNWDDFTKIFQTVNISYPRAWQSTKARTSEDVGTLIHMIMIVAWVVGAAFSWIDTAGAILSDCCDSVVALGGVKIEKVVGVGVGPASYGAWLRRLFWICL